MVPSVGRMEGDAVEGSPGVMVLGERSASAPLIPSIVGGGILVGTSWREGLEVLGAGGESSLALTSAGSGSLAQGEPLLQWVDPQNPVLALFPLDDATESMEWESLDVGIVSVLEALNHAMGALRDVVVPSGRVLFHPASCLYLPFSIFCILIIVFLQSLKARSRGKS